MSTAFDTNDYYWYKKNDTELAKSVFAYVNFIAANQEYRDELNMDNLRLYGNYDVLGLSGYFFRKPEAPSSANRVTLNVVQSMVDTVHSKITKNKPKPYFLTDGGDFTLQQKAKKLNRFIEGQFHAMDYYSKESRSYLDSLIFGTGVLKYYKKDNKVCAERVFINEIVIDDREAVYGQPRQMHQKKYIHRDVLKGMFPKHKTAIDAAGRDSNGDVTFGANKQNPDMILVIESWRLPSYKKATDGRHAICIENQELFSEQYDKDYFPFTFQRWTERPLGFFGKGIAEILTGLQIEINKILRTIQVAMHLVCIPKVFVDSASKIVSSHIDNKIGGLIKYSGTLPTMSSLGNISPELFSHLDRLYGRAFEEVGLSQLSATSQKPAGLNSGKALRVYNDLETERFMANAQRREKTYLDAAKIIIDLSKEISEENDGQYPVYIQSRYGLEKVDWSEINLEEDQYQMQLYPTSALSSSPSARLQEVQELIQAQMISMDEGMKLLDFPDINQMYQFRNAPLEDIDRAIEKIVNDLEYTTPEPFQNLEAGKERFTNAYAYYKNANAPEEVLELLRRWVTDAEELTTRAHQKLAADQQAAQMKAEQDVIAMQEAEALAAEEAKAIQQAPLPLEMPATPSPTLPGDDNGLLTAGVPVT